VPLLDSLRSTKGIYSEFYDPDGAVYGLPTYPYRWAPAIYATRRQLSDRGLRPGGQQPCAQIIWRHRGKRRVGYLYLVALALPKRPMTPAKWGAVGLALLARMTCPVCGVANTGELRPELRGLPQDEFIKTFVAHAPDLTTEQETQLLVSLGLLSDSAVVSAA
jgi:hypothetical protein